MTAPPSAVLLDVGGVFLLPEEAAISGAIARGGFEVDPALLARAHYHGAARIGVEHEPVFPEAWDDYLHGYCDLLGVAPEVRDDVLDHLRSEFAVMGAWADVVPGTKDALAELVSTGVPVGIVSNADGTVATLLRELEVLQVGPGPGVQVRCVIDSAEVGVEKPDPRIFRIALEALGVNAADTWYVGDTPGIDVIGARRAGIHPVLMDPFDLHEGAEYDRVRSLAELVDRLRALA